MKFKYKQLTKYEKHLINRGYFAKNQIRGTKITIDNAKEGVYIILHKDNKWRKYMRYKDTWYYVQIMSKLDRVKEFDLHDNRIKRDWLRILQAPKYSIIPEYYELAKAYMNSLPRIHDRLRTFRLIKIRKAVIGR